MRLLDTDTCVSLLRGNRQVIDRYEATGDTVATTWVTASELFYGAAKSAAPERGRAAVETFLSTLPSLGLDVHSSRIFGDTKAFLERKGQRVADADLFIAAVAVANDAVVVTGNRRHYARIPGLRLEDWMRGPASQD